MNLDRIVVWDPTEEFWEGSLVDQSKERVIKSKGGAVLPVDPGLFKLSGVGGYMRRAWGAGWPLDHFQPRMACPLALYFPASHRLISWAIRIVPAHANLEKSRTTGTEMGEGQIKLVGDSGQHGLSIPVTPKDPGVDIRKLGKADEYGGWTAYGTVLAHPPGDGHYAFALYGTAPGFRVAWAAISATEARAE